ncbi:Fibrinogen-like protein A,Ryncolin-4,Angiopoietin-related protein 7,Angiopoietin-related protein 1,Ficolin-3,Ficolin-1-B,Techylectin-5A,Ficolin-2,Ryncolin-1,Tenascin-R,Protein scabrous,Fibrinogen-like protein 1,Angiopoietin-1,Tenascin-X,Fibrinogen C domain-containing protein 1-A,Tenascin-N,Ryncolin-3,Tenascin,Fibrinogen C domain-containing protein 1,Fibrinogen gamma chain,Ryncolin-2,Fibrinogen beta chain,Angiopoietin-related protein 6,Techylectin-5B,Angiopoietin-related protein 2,Microfibril-associated gly|uniref:Fibrinogen C-terminal domain-containing protein n=1 Tax=Mytilus coruscus TaxID=42192 RepID=A0A6J8EI90_MYTCO|nr:Fibrinogen-like protein A,Ryncolin-4,Angiopoietin-related protein 7,Angiopoietin-related protein 1,Ficolin-3,Ficolin-1-B,Techylectin-5A,Ficolin-2,Ryncolin-1,Tenascin-R,Protein scabrous,Fibrinogen-like protein 1,Angiopoietin-1,Tenascin-X,Fibrinogen C domain-containing protein 1-A,Tenascin-N,Ryncolin-3,Tenascin,Fibrinogen C domain-containing protein 1,Fibrinogen gamma chain,Ryncolin-2,Fibrinogen beta chain,Angiopoietin-related protein 6,Techylectin-5B,Angiopoietin-related protein 2,Microfibril-ass
MAYYQHNISTHLCSEFSSKQKLGNTYNYKDIPVRVVVSKVVVSRKLEWNYNICQLGCLYKQLDKLKRIFSGQCPDGGQECLSCSNIETVCYKQKFATESGGTSYDFGCSQPKVIQRRINGFVDFYRGWTAYKEGFGNVSGEYWLGNDNIHEITSHGNHDLRIELQDFDGNKTYAEYSIFNVADEGNGYRLLVYNYSGNAGDSLTHHNGMKFSTFDKDNDQSGSNCADSFKGAWWYRDCHFSNLNGKYLAGFHLSSAGEYHKSTTIALLEESASYYIDKFGEIDILADIRHGWRKNAKDASIIAIEYHKSTTIALLEESASYYIDKFGEIDILADTRHGWRKNAKDASIIAIDTNLPRECSDIDFKNHADGVYTIYPDGRRAVPVYCDMTTEHFRWTIIQRRINGFVDFYRRWSSYKEGFGNANGEYWLGSKKVKIILLQAMITFMNEIASHSNHDLRIELEDFDGNMRYAEYSTFKKSYI